MLVEETARELIFGSDPEHFAGYKKGDDIFVLPPAFFREIGVEHVRSKGRGNFYSFYRDDAVEIVEDGVAFEYTLRPSKDWEELFDRIQNAKEILGGIISQAGERCEKDVFVLPTINYEVERWENKPESYKKCLIFGCDPDYDAFAKGSRGRVVDALKHPWRYGGGHIHVSGVPGFRENPLMAVKSMAIGIGLAAVHFSNVPALDRARTFLYGKAGKFRPQKYRELFEGIPHTDFGIEYRTPSNAWTGSREIAAQLFKWAEISVREIFEKGLCIELLQKYSEEIQRIIIDVDQKAAGEFLSYIESRI